MTQEVDNFIDFFKRHTKPYYVFGVTPLCGPLGSQGKSRLRASVLLTLLLLQWGSVAYFFVGKQNPNDRISTIANWMQMLSNCLTLTTTFYTTMFKNVQFGRVIAEFEEIDKRLSAMGLPINYDRQLRTSSRILCAFIMTFCLLLSHDFYLTVLDYEIYSAWYWTVCVAPMVVYSVGVLQSMFIVHWVKHRCSLVNVELKRIRSRREVKSPQNNSTFVVVKEVSHADDEELLMQLLGTTNHLCKLLGRINGFFGLFFLTTIFTLFTITAIQLYYCYLTIVNLDTLSENFSTGFLLLPFLVVLWNFFLVVGLTTVCEKVSNEAYKILQSSLSLQMKETHLMNWFHPGISQMRLSAFGFFFIDHGMLCSFMAALITYLVVFIQFYSMVKDKGGYRTKLLENPHKAENLLNTTELPLIPGRSRNLLIPNPGNEPKP